MTAARLASAMPGDVMIGIARGPIELRVEDRLQSLALPIRKMSAAMVGVLVGSLIAHAVLVAMAFVSGRVPPPQAPREISVEVVREMPKPTPVAPKPPETKAAAAPTQKPAAIEKPPQPAPVKPPVEPAKSAPAQQQPNTSPAKAEAPKPDAGEIKALQAELAQLRAEQAALKAASEPPQTASSAASGMAKALPSIGLGADDVVGYQELVFSQLAKAKGDGDYRGQAGVTSVKFEIDSAGALVRAEVTAPSGNPTLDAQALDIVRRAAPFPPPPTEADRIVYANVNFVPPKPR